MKTQCNEIKRITLDFIQVTIDSKKSSQNKADSQNQKKQTNKQKAS